MKLNGYETYTRGILPANTSAADFVNIDFKFCQPINMVPLAAPMDQRSKATNERMTEKANYDISQFPIINI